MCMYTFVCLLARFFIVKIILLVWSTVWPGLHKPSAGVWPFCCPSEMKGGKEGEQGWILKWTPSLKPRAWSKNHNQSRVTPLWSLQPCSNLAQASGTEITAKKREVIMGLG